MQVALNTTHFGGEARTTSRVAVAADTDRPGWYYMTRYEEWHLPVLEDLPGVTVTPAKLYAPANLVVARPDLFEVVYDPAGLANPTKLRSELATSLPRTVDTPDKLGSTELKPHQIEGVAFLRQPPGGLLGDAVGVGKSLQALVAAISAGYTRVLVCGTLLSRSVWCSARGDAQRRLGVKITHLEGMKDVGLDGPPPGWIYCHYDLLDRWFPYISTRLQPECVILDEAHQLRGPKTTRAKRARSITQLKSVKARYVLTASQVQRNRQNLWVLLDCAQPGAWGSYHEFCRRYVGAVKGPRAWLYGDDAREFLEETDGDDAALDTHDEELQARLNVSLLRREQSVAQPYLPEVDRRTLDADLEPAAMEEYRVAEHDVRKYLALYGKDTVARTSGEQLLQVTHLCSILSRAKIPSTVALAREAVETSGKVVVYTWYKDSAKEIAKALTSGPTPIEVFGPTTGDTPGAVRERRAAAFRESTKPCAFVATLSSASESINDLVAANVGITHDLHWVPHPLLQAIGRLRREGQHRSVTWWFVRAPGTIEDRMLEKLELAAVEIAAGRGGADAKHLVAALGHGSASAEVDELQGFIDDILATDTAGLS